MAEPDVYDQSKLGSFRLLPGELRNIIYRMLLSNQYAHQQQTHRHALIPTWAERCKLAPLHPNILQCNHQIYDEAINILHGENIWIVAKIDIHFWPLLRKATQLRSRIDTDNVKFPAMMIDLSIRPPVSEPQYHVNVVMDEGMIEDFIRGLWHISTHANTRILKRSSLVLKLCRTEFHTVSNLIPICLNPFILVYGLRYFEAQSQPDLGILVGVSDRAESGSELETHLQAVSQDCIAQGDAAYFAEDLYRAVHGCHHVKDYISHRMMLKGYEHRRPRATAARKAQLREDMNRLENYERVIDRYGSRTALAIDFYQAVQIRGPRRGALPSPITISELTQMRLKLCLARAHGQHQELEDEMRLFKEALNAHGDKTHLLYVLAELCPWKTPMQMVLLVSQHTRLMRGQAIDSNTLIFFWHSLDILF